MPREALVQAFVDDFGDWADSVRSYQWKQKSYRQMMEEVEPFFVQARKLSLALGETGDGQWDADQRQVASILARAICSWGGVSRQPRGFSSEVVESVFRAALGFDVGDTTPMNSGWTKVSAFATHHLDQPNMNGAHVIWDSRVATAITHRMDALLCNNALNPDGLAPSKVFESLGRVRGRKTGTRTAGLGYRDGYQFRWPDGYRSWPAQWKASALVGEIRDVLNGDAGRYRQMPGSKDENGNEPAGKWTVWGVGLALFMDGE